MTPQKPNYDEKLDQMLLILGEIKGTMLLHTAELIGLSKCAEENKAAIKGNGKDGLETRMAMQEDGMKRVNIVGSFLLFSILADVVARILLR